MTRRLPKHLRALFAQADDVLALADREPHSDVTLDVFESWDHTRRLAWVVARVKQIHGVVLHPNQVACALALLGDSTIVELATGEGKTFAAIAAAVAAAGDGPGVHVATANPYLAARDARIADDIAAGVGLSVGVTAPGGEVSSKQQAYGHRLVFGSANEFGFDYLRDCTTTTPSAVTQGLRRIAIVDEADSVLIDDATTPLIVSANTEPDHGMYAQADALVRSWEEDVHFDLDRATSQVGVLGRGIVEAEDHFSIENLYAPENAVLVHHLDRALLAHFAFQRDVDYAVENDEVHIVDANTGRIAAGRQWTDGLHQAVQAKEGLTPGSQSMTAATLSVQAYWRSYEQLSGLTGTTEGADEEFERVYDSHVVELPSNSPLARIDEPDVIWGTQASKWQGVADEIEDHHARRQPVLAGCVDIADSERLSSILTERGVAHNVLNAKNAAAEADVIAQAGMPGAVTIATAMAGRGVDILLGGNTPSAQSEVRAAGGLAVVGSGRHRSRRVDDQLRGRAGRQGDAGSSRFHVSLEDDLVRDHSKLRGVSALIGDGAVTSKLAAKAVESAQRNIESAELAARMQAVEYDDVLWRATSSARERRDRLWASADAMLEELLRGVDRLARQELERLVRNEPADALWAGTRTVARETLAAGSETDALVFLVEAGRTAVLSRWEEFGSGSHMVACQVLGHVLNERWVEFLAWVSAFRDGVGLHGKAGRNPLSVWQSAVMDTYDEFVERSTGDLSGHFLTVRVSFHKDAAEAAQQAKENGGVVAF